jgi:drug/metabolite transporter (DMT)-like permease
MRSQSVAPLINFSKIGLTENGEQNGNECAETAFEAADLRIWPRIVTHIFFDELSNFMPNNSRNGFIFALSGFGMLSLGDAVIKTMAGQWPGPAVAAMRFCIGAVGLAVILLWREGRAGFRLPMAKFQLLRGAGLAVATLCFFSAIFLMPLAEAVAIQFTSPMITALLSALFLGERTSKHIWAATLVAFGGVMLILRPNLAILGWAALLPLIAAVAMALVMIGNRKVADAGSGLLMQFLIAAIAAPFLIVAAVLGHFSQIDSLHINVPELSILGRCALVAVTATISHWLVYTGTRRASAAQIAPSIYIQILIATSLGILFFNDIPDLLSIIGSIIIIATGLFMWRVNAPKSVVIIAE